MFFAKIVVLVLMTLILINLGRALYFMMIDHDDPARRLRALKWRVWLSVTLLLFLMVAFFEGWIKPHALLP